MIPGAPVQHGFQPQQRRAATHHVVVQRRVERRRRRAARRLELILRDLAARQLIRLVRIAPDRLDQVGGDFPVDIVEAALARLHQRHLADQLAGAPRQPRHAAGARLGIIRLGQREEVLPILLAQPRDQLVALAQAGEAALLGQRLGQPRGQAQVLGALLQQRRAFRDDGAPVRLLDLGHPVALIERGVVEAPRFLDGVEFGGEEHVLAARRGAGERSKKLVELEGCHG